MQITIRFGLPTQNSEEVLFLIAHFLMNLASGRTNCKGSAVDKARFFPVSAKGLDISDKRTGLLYAMKHTCSSSKKAIGAVRSWLNRPVTGSLWFMERWQKISITTGEMKNLVIP